MKSLSKSQARRCETATTHRCRCRCRGAFHGAQRVTSVTLLNRGDPHYPGKPVDEEAGAIQLALFQDFRRRAFR